MKISEIKPEVYEMADRAMEKIKPEFEKIDNIAQINTQKVMEAFQDNRVAEGCFAGTTGYGYDDMGRDILEKIYAQVFGTEAALVRINFVNGTHALSTAMFSLVKPGDTILAATGLPYDTLRTAIGIEGNCHGSLKFYGIDYAQVDLTAEGLPDYEGIKRAAADPKVTAVMIQRSRGYEYRKAFTVEEIGKICSAVKEVNPKANIMVDNCYGEFTDVIEPSNVGADLIVGSLIKNPGGGIAPTGGYIAGKAELVERASMRLTTPGIGGECGATLGNNRLLFQGFFMAPHVVAQAMKTAVFCAAMMDEMGIESSPSITEKRSDIIQMIKLGSEDNMKKFCLGIQAGAPVDSYVTPEPWPMPGYNCPVIMAAGAFIQGSSIELSADGPIRDPYVVYMQGGLTFESGKLGIMMAVSAMMDK
ncbi:MAG: aminotransferase class I/II-fold pyridoxal phosphate-dependent enzyme [Candidatus Limivicinus sp.]|jgi:cystathionine beta-lyase family protein involved in aluminum resistance